MRSTPWKEKQPEVRIYTEFQGTAGNLVRGLKKDWRIRGKVVWRRWKQKTIWEQAQSVKSWPMLTPIRMHSAWD